MVQPLADAGRARGVGAIAHGNPFVSFGRRAANRASLGHLERDLGSRSLFDDDLDDLRNDVACSLHHDGVADTNVLARDLIFVVQGRPLDRHPTDVDRRKKRGRVERASPAHRDDDVFHDRGLLNCRELVGGRPPRFARNDADLVLKMDRIDLGDDAIDFEIELVTPAEPPFTPLPYPVDRVVRHGIRRGFESVLNEHLECVEMAIRPREALQITDVPGVEAQGALTRLLWVDLPKAPGRRIAWVHERFATCLENASVERLEVGLLHVDLAAHLDSGRHRIVFGGSQLLGNRLYRAQIGCDVLANEPVPSCGADLQHSIDIGERDRQAVDLRFGDKPHLLTPRGSLRPPEPGVETCAVENIAE